MLDYARTGFSIARAGCQPAGLAGTSSSSPRPAVAAGPRPAGPGCATAARARPSCWMARPQRVWHSRRLPAHAHTPSRHRAAGGARPGRHRPAWAQLRGWQAGRWTASAPAQVLLAAHRTAAQAGSRRRAALFGTAMAGGRSCSTQLYFARACAQGAARGLAQHGRACRPPRVRVAAEPEGNTAALSTSQQHACTVCG